MLNLRRFIQVEEEEVISEKNENEVKHSVCVSDEKNDLKTKGYIIILF